jgi:hypothetical protein
MLWARGGRVKWIALGLTAAGVAVCSDIPLILFDVFAERLHLSVSVLSGQILTVVLDRPSTEILLLMGVFYLWGYVRSAFFPAPSVLPREENRPRSASVAT